MRFLSDSNCRIVMLLCLGLLASVGCELPQAPAEREAKAPEPIYPEPTAEPAPDSSPTDSDSTTARVAEESGRAVKAQTGTGKRKPGKAGILMTPINAYFSSQERIAYLQIESGLKTFRASNGRKPKNFEEFEKKILKPAAIKLPALKAGDTYFFDPKRGRYGELMIREGS